MNSSNRLLLKERYPSSMTGSVDNLEYQLEDQSKLNLNIKQKSLTQGDLQFRTSQRNTSQFVQDKLGRRYSECIEKLYLYGKHNDGLKTDENAKEELKKLYDLKSKLLLANTCALNRLPYSFATELLPNRINDQLTSEQSLNSLTGHKSDKNSKSDNRDCVKLIDNQNNLNINQLETFLRDNHLDEINLNLDYSDLRSQKDNCSSKATNTQCLKKSSKSRFLAKRMFRRNRQSTEMNEEMLISKSASNQIISAAGNISNPNKWIGQTSSTGSSPVLLSPTSNTSDECPTNSSVEMRLSNFTSSLSTYSLCSRSSSSNILNIIDEDNDEKHQADYYDDNDEKINDKKYEYDLTRSMPSLDLIQSLNSSSLPRLLKQCSQPKLTSLYDQSNEDRSLNNDLIDDSSIDNQKLIMTRFGFIRNVPAAKNLIMSCSHLNEKDVKEDKESMNYDVSINQLTNEITKKTSFSLMDLSNKQTNEQSVNLSNISNLSNLSNLSNTSNNPINQQRSLSALTINCGTKLNKSFKSSNCTNCSSNLCKCKLKANSLLTINQTSAFSAFKPKIPKKPSIEEQINHSTGSLLAEKNDAINCCNKHVDLYINNKQLVNDNLKLQERFDDLLNTVQQMKNKEEKATNEQINSLQRKIELLTLELQEAKDEKELIEFRLFELELTSTNGTTPIETYNYHKTKEAFRNFKNVTRTAINGLSGDESCSSVSNTLSPSSDETKDQIDLLDCKDNQHLLFTNSLVILTSEDEGLGHDNHSRGGLYRSEEDSGPSSLENSSEKKSKLNKNELSLDKQDRSTSPLMDVNELEQQLSKLEQHNNELIEQNLELEEAENDSRLVSQKLKVKVDNLLEQIENLQIDLEQTKDYIKTNETKFNESKNREQQLLEQIKDLQTKLDEERNISSLSTINSSDDCWPESNCKSPTNLDSLNDFSSANDNPICSSIKPVKIDLCNQTSHNSNANDQLDSLNEQILKLNETKENSNRSNEQSINQNLKALENNYKQMNDRLKHLQLTNKEFVKDLEQREHLLTRKELLFRDWITKEIILKRSLAELTNELDELNKQFNQSQRMRAELRTKCEELHQQLTDIEADDNHDQLLSMRQKEMHELISSYNNSEYDHRLIELLNKFKMQYDAHCTKEMEKEEQTQIVLDKLCLQEQELNEKMRKLVNKQNELKDQIYKQEKNLEKFNKSYKEEIEKLEQERLKISKKLKETILTMEKCTSKTIEENQIEQNNIKEKLNKALDSFKLSQENYDKLVKQISSIELTVLDGEQNEIRQRNLMKSANDQLLNRYEQEAVNKYQEEQISNLLNEREELKNKLVSLEKSIDQFVQKEAAYKETLVKADRIVFEMESQYKYQIEQLESNEKILNERIMNLEKDQLENKLKNANLKNSLTSQLNLNTDTSFNILQKTTSKNSSAASGLSSPTVIRRNSELVAELLKSESRECQLREQISKLEQSELNLKKHLENSNKEKQQLESDIQEIEELNNKIQKLRRDLHQTMQQLDFEREKNQQFAQLIDQKEDYFKNELKELLDENHELRCLVKQQQSGLIDQELNYVNVNTESSRLNLKTGCDIKLNKNHVLQINVNETNTKQNNSVRLHL